MRTALAALAATILAAPAFAKGGEIVAFNGFSVTVNYAAIGETADLPPEGVKALAEKACKSNGKAADFQASRAVSGFMKQYFFICL